MPTLPLELYMTGGGVGGRGEGVGIEITDNITYDIRKRFPLPRLFVLAAARFHY